MSGVPFWSGHPTESAGEAVQRPADAAPSFTPGPWTTWHDESTRDFGLVCARGNFPIANVEFQVGPTKTLVANACLIAAAPDLFGALQMLYAETDDYQRINKLGGHDNQCMRWARAAIAKALGGSTQLLGSDEGKQP